MISYYELLKRIEKGDIPEKIKVRLTPGTSRIYTANYDDSDFSHYFIDGDVDNDCRYYLAECFLESDMFEKNIEIIEEKKDKKIHWEEKESLNGEFNQKETITILARRTEKLKKAFNEIIEYMEEN